MLLQPAIIACVVSDSSFDIVFKFKAKIIVVTCSEVNGVSVN